MNRLVWAYGRHVNRTIANLGQTFVGQGYDLEKFSMVVPRWRKIPAMVASMRWNQGRIRGFSSIHPWTYRSLHVPKHLENVPVFVFGSQILSSAPHFFYTDLNFQTIVSYREAGIRTFMYDDVDLGILKAQVAVQSRQYAAAAAIFAMSWWIRQAILDTGAIPPERVHWVGAGSNLNMAFDDNPYSEKNFEAQTLLFVGRDFQRKGGALLLEAWQEVHSRLPGAKLVLAGPGDSWTNPQQNVLAYGDIASDRVVELLTQSTGFVLPTLWEPYGIAFLEAFSCGVPAIGPHRMAIPEFLHDGQNGYTYAEDRPEALAELIVRLLSDRDAALRMSRQAFEDSKHYQWGKVYQRMHRIIQVESAAGMVGQ